VEASQVPLFARAGCEAIPSAPLSGCFAIRADHCMLSRRVSFGRSDMITMRIVAAAALAAVMLVSTASAQQTQTQRVAGTIDKVEGKTLYIKSATGPVTLTLADNAVIVARVKASAADNQGRRLCRQRRRSAARRHTEGGRAAHFSREHAR
jgi:hypothetical protein